MARDSPDTRSWNPSTSQRLCTQFVIGHTTLSRLTLITTGNTVASRRAAEKAGFNYIGAPREDPTGVVLMWHRPGEAEHPRGARVICVSRGRLLLVEHHDRDSGEHYWCPPGGGREPGETLEETALREVFEETGIEVRILSRVYLPTRQTYALFIAEPIVDRDAKPTVDLSAEKYLVGAGWHAIDLENPLGPLNPDYWLPLAPAIRQRLEVPHEA